MATELVKGAADGVRTTPDGSDALVLWASDTVRDEGVMVAFGLQLLGIRPVWNSRGIVKGLERMPVGPEQFASRRRNVVFTTSGLFRDLYGNQLMWLDRAVLMALAGAGTTIKSRYPELSGALDQALAGLPPDQRALGDESLVENEVADRWVADTRA